MTLSEKRLAICKQCPLYKEGEYGPTCNKNLYINKEQKTSWLPKSGYVKGCGCKLNFKTKNPNAHCIIKLW